MKLSLFLVASGAMLFASASPLKVRDIATDIVYDYVTVTVTDDDTVPTVAPVHAAAPEVVVSETTVVVVYPPPAHTHSFPHAHPHKPEPEQAQAPSPAPVPESYPHPAPAPQKPEPSTTYVIAPEPTTSKPAPVSLPESTGTPSTPSSGNPLIDTALVAHNLHRANHSASAMTWDSTIASYAQVVADKCVFAHDRSEGDGNYGQNIAFSGTSADVSKADPSDYVKAAITDMWYDSELNNYNGFFGKDSPPLTNLDAWGHFTQVVWKGSTQVGCAVKYCPAGTMEPNFNVWYTVCNYYPAGNVGGEYAANVAKPLGMANAS